MTTSPDIAPSGIRLSEQADGVVLLTLDRPPANALSNAAVERLTSTIGDLADRRDVPALVLTGAGDRFFCAGGDVTEAIGGGAGSMVARMAGFHALLRALEEYPRPVVCAINGWCVGGGIEMALFADRVHASSAARFVFPEIDHGLFPAVKGIDRARRILGDRAARSLLLSGTAIGAHEAVTIGLVDVVVDPADLMAAALAHAHSAAAKPPVIYAELKRALRSGTAHRSDEEQLVATVTAARTVFDDPVARTHREAWND